jgi:hypothetical protein
MKNKHQNSSKINSTNNAAPNGGDFDQSTPFQWNSQKGDREKEQYNSEQFDSQGQPTKNVWGYSQRTVDEADWSQGDNEFIQSQSTLEDDEDFDDYEEQPQSRKKAHRNHENSVKFHPKSNNQY